MRLPAWRPRGRAFGIAAWLRVARPHRTAGRIALWGVAALTGAVWLVQPWAPPPPSATAVAVGGLANWLLPAWAWWIDRTAALRPDDAASRP